RVQALLARLSVELVCELARTTLGRSQLGALGQGDVVVCGERRVLLRSGRGGFRAREHALGLCIETEFEAGEGMSKELMFEDVPVELTVEAGRVRMSARELLELKPGAVVELERPLGGPVELYAGG